MEEIKMKMQEYVGTRDHNKMYNRDLAKQHPIKAIEGLEEKIAELEEYHVYLYNRIGELKQIMEQEKLSLQNITDAEQAAKLNILTTGETSVGSLTAKKEEALVQIRVAGENLLNGLDDKLSVAQEYVVAAQTSATDAETYAAQAEGYAEAAQVDVEALRAEKVGFEDYATATKGGVVKVNPTYDATSIYDGRLKAESKTISQYTSLGDNAFISKGTLENVLADKLKDYVRKDEV